MQFTNSSIPKLFFQPPVSLGKTKSDLISKPSFFFLPYEGEWSPVVLPLGLWGTADTISLSTSAYLPLGLVPRPAVGTEVVWGRRATSVLAAQVLTSPPKYFKRAKLGCGVCGLVYSLQLSSQHAVLGAGLQAVGEAMGSYRAFLVAPGGLLTQRGEKKRQGRAMWRSSCADFSSYEDHFQLLHS